MTGFYRDGYCRTGPEDVGQHTVCVQVTEEFLDFSVLDGNDLVTPHPEWGFPGLKPGDKWCVCVTRWKSALDHNRAAPVDLEATHDPLVPLAPYLCRLHPFWPMHGAVLLIEKLTFHAIWIALHCEGTVF